MGARCRDDLALRPVGRRRQGSARPPRPSAIALVRASRREVEIRLPRASLAGRKELGVDLVREGIAWFADYGSPPLIVPLPAQALAPRAHRRRRHAARAAADGHRQLRARDAARPRGGRSGARDRRVLGRGAAGQAADRAGARRRSGRADVSSLVPPKSHWWRTAWSRLGRGPVEWLAGPLDVFHFSDWMYPPQRAGVRATTIHDLFPLRHPDWVHPQTFRMHSRKYAHAAETCDLIVVNSEFTAGEVVELLASRASGSASRTRRWGPAFGLTAPRASSAARTCSPSRRSSGARTSRRCSRR